MVSIHGAVRAVGLALVVLFFVVGVMKNIGSFAELKRVEVAVIVLACVIFTVFASAPPAVDPSLSAVTQVWSYVGELIFNMLILVGAVKMADRVVREMMGL